MISESPVVRTVVGCMSGTSLDAIDAALVRLRGRGLSMTVEPLRYATRPLGSLRAPLARLSTSRAVSVPEVVSTCDAFSRLHIDAICDAGAGAKLDFIAIHGQTIFHKPPLSWQMLAPAPIAHEFAAPVVFDLRAADIAAGGQGAPITPLADFVLFADAGETRAVVNLGGFANFTRLPAALRDERATSQIQAADICACNQLLDTIAVELLNVQYDSDGARAMRGAIDDGFLRDLIEILTAQRSARRSLGSSDEPRLWPKWLPQSLDAASVARTACRAIAEVVGRDLQGVQTILLAGGGARNQALTSEIAAVTRGSVYLTDRFGVPGTYREAIAMAVLGGLCQDGVPITLPQVTGVPPPAPRAGVWAGIQNCEWPAANSRPPTPKNSSQS